MVSEWKPQLTKVTKEGALTSHLYDAHRS